jgi:RNA polymerase sigma factor (sigma-70 family)
MPRIGPLPARLCEGRVRLLARSRLRNFPQVRREEQTTDIANEALLRLCRAMRGVAPATPLDLTRFLAEIIRRVLLDRLKSIRRRHRPTGPLGPEPGRAPEDTDHPFDADLMADFHGYVDSLPGEEKILFDLLYYRGLTTAAAAEYLGLPTTTLKRQWVRARLRARERFGRDPTET